MTDSNERTTGSRKPALLALADGTTFRGLAFGAEGEANAVAYVQQRFKAIGFEPGNGDSYVQAGPMAEITTR